VEVNEGTTTKEGVFDEEENVSCHSGQ